MRAGFVAIVGLPNVGKSTLLNRLLGQKIAIASPRPQTTRNRILGVRNLSDESSDGAAGSGRAQLVLVDTPGLHRPGARGHSRLNRYMLEEVRAAVGEVDALLLMVEAPSGEAARRGGRVGYRIPKDHEVLVDTVAAAGKPAVLAINKIDLCRDKQALLPVMEAWSRALPLRALVPISAAQGDGEARLLAELVALLPEADAALFPEEMVTDRAERWLAAEMVREQVFLLTRQEIPYAAAVTIEAFDERPEMPAPRRGRGRAAEAAAQPAGERGGDVMIHATIHVEKEAQKRIVVGEGGRMVREIGSRARHEIGLLLGCPVHLKLFVRVEPDWSEQATGLRKMGYE
jgi:GTP-binding protein Era